LAKPTAELMFGSSEEEEASINRSVTAWGSSRATDGRSHSGFLCPLPTSSSSWWYFVPWSMPKATATVYTVLLYKNILGKTQF